MSPQPQPPADPLIDEIRQRRREIAAEFDFDVKKLFEELQRRQAEHPERVVDPRTRPTNP